MEGLEELGKSIEEKKFCKPTSWLVCNSNGCFRPGCVPGGTRKRSLNAPHPVPIFGRKGHLLGDETYSRVFAAMLRSEKDVNLSLADHMICFDPISTEQKMMPTTSNRPWVMGVNLSSGLLATKVIRNQGRQSLNYADPSDHFLDWEKQPFNVLVIKKVMDSEVTRCFKELTKWLIEEKRMMIFAEATAVEDPLVSQDEKFSAVRSKLCIFKEGDQLDDKIDFIVCMGGDGTLLHASSLFQCSCPPVMAFHLGSLGFLTSFRFRDFRDKITDVLTGHAGLTLRSRLQCDFTKRDKEDEAKTGKSRYLVLNEVVVDRGPSSYLTNLDIYCNDHHVTSVQGDGLIVSTPTGSTAYAVAAGASMVHPSVAAILVTPVCPHSLSFRPIILPAGVELKIVPSPESRSSAWTSFDGRNRQELKVGDSIQITTSIYPVPCVNSENQMADWFKSLAECLHWNVRQRQRQLSITDCHV